MKREDLLAPKYYNIVDEIEKYTEDKAKKALMIYHENGEIEELTYINLLEKASQAAHVLANYGLTKGDAIIIMVPRSAEAYITYIAALKLGLIIIPSSEMLRAKDIDYRITHAGAKAVIAFEPFINEFDHVEHMADVKSFVIGEAHQPWIPLLKEMENQPQQFTNNVRTTCQDIAFLAYT
ncbi:MAG: AMP-binding protein, partial [Lysinibacillus sp.]